MDIHVYIHQVSDTTLARIERKIDRIQKGETTMSQQVTDLIAEVEATRAGEESAKALLDQLFAIVQANMQDPAALQKAIDDLKAERDTLAAAVVADTPTQPAP